MDAKIFRINYKSDFVLTINSDAGWAVPFCIKFWTGMPSHGYFAGFDGENYVNCRVGETPTQLLVMFDDHHMPIGPLRMQIAYHTTIEEFPDRKFDEVTNPINVTVDIDGTEYQVMLDFTGEDAPELEFNLPAYANEAERIHNELQRQQNEAARIAAELQREQATAAAVQGAENVNAQLNGTTLTVTNRNGVSTSVNTKGEQGEQGPVGPQGETGETGPRGTSIVSFTPKSTTATTLIYTVTFSDGTTQDVAIPKGAKGDTGATGPQGPQGDTGVSITAFTYASETETDMIYTVTFSDSTTQQVSIPKGAKGDTGPQGPVGPQGPQGPMGDVAVITPEQQAAFTIYSETGQNTNGPMTQKAVTDELSHLKWVDILSSSKIGYAYYCSGNTGETAVGETESSAFRYVIINVAEGDMVKIYGRGGDAPRLWAILDADHKIINKADAQMITFDGIVTMPSNAAYFVFNNNNTYYATPKCEYISADNIEEETTIKKRVELGTSSLYIPTWNSRNSRYEWNNANASHYIVPVVAGDMYEVIANSVHNADIQWVTSYYTPVLNKNSYASTIDNTIHTILRDTKEIYIVPSDARFMVVWAVISGVDFTPIINKIVDVKDETEKNNDAISVINGIESFDLTTSSYKDKAFYCGDGVGEIASGINTLTDWECIVLPVNSGDVYIISGYGGGTPRLWAMLDKDMRIISTADANTEAHDLLLEIPTGVKYLALNNYWVNNISPRWDFYNTHATIEENANLGVSAPYTIVGGKWTNVNSEHYIVRVSGGDKVIVTANASYNAGVHWLIDSKTAINNQSPYLSAYDATLHTIYAGTTQELVVPIDAQFMYVAGMISGGDHTPSAVLIRKNITEDDDVYFNKSDFTPIVQDHPLIYEADDKINTNTHITSAVAYPNGEIIATRQGGSVVKIALDGNETTLLTINGANDWRGLWMDRNLNVYVTPFDGLKSINQAPNLNNGIYRLPYGSNTMTKVLSLPVGYCMWTFAEDNDGYIYAGTYQLVTKNPLLYRSSDGGETWEMIYNFVNICPTGRHVHCILYNRYNNAMYAIIGEYNEMYKSTDHAVTWEALNVKFVDKGTSVLDTQHGILVGSDNAYCCDIDLLLPDDKSHKRVARGWSNTPFALRQSDLTGYIYAFCKIDAAAASASYFPQMADVTDTSALDAWIATNPSVYSGWKQYNNQTKDIYPEDCVRPQHFMIMMSRDDGLTWEIIYKEKATHNYSDGFWTAGYFRNGECLVGRVIASSYNTRDFVKPLVISEGRHKYTSDGIDCEGDIFIVTNTNNFVEAL